MNNTDKVIMLMQAATILVCIIAFFSFFNLFETNRKSNKKD